jgi:hypothetical protein
MGTDEKGKPLPAAEVVQTLFNGKISTRSGMAILAKDSNDRDGEEVIVVGAKIINSHP